MVEGMKRRLMSSSSSSSVPLRYRLPNPPPVFVGRAHELDAIAAAMARGPVAVLHGPGGIGKTALALRALTRLPEVAVERALLIELRPGPPMEAPRLQIIEALARAQGVARADGADVVVDDDGADGTLIDLAEEGGFAIVLDDLHHAPPAVAAALLVLLARYARRSRWIVTSRVVPSVPELIPQLVATGALADDELRQLAAAFAPTLAAPAVDDAIAGSGGSPWMLQQILAAPGAAGEDRLLGGLPPGAREFLDALAWVDRALPLDVLGSLTTSPLREILDTLEQRGLVQAVAGGYRLHDVVRRILRTAPGPGRPPPSPLASARPLTVHGHPEAMIEGTRLLLLAGAHDEAWAALETCGEPLIALGHAPRLWQLLELSPDRRLARWRLRCAVALAQPVLLERLEPPGDPDLAGRLLWARGLAIQGRLDEALALAHVVLDEAAGQGDARLAGDAGLVAVECLAVRNRFVDAIRLIEALPPASDDSALALRESWAGYCLAAAGRIDEAARRVDRLRDARLDLPAGVQRGVMLNVARVLGRLGRIRDAYELSRTVVDAALPSASILSAHFVNAMAAGRLAEAGQLLARLEPFRPWRSPLRGVQAVHTLFHRLHVGALAGFDQAVMAAKQDLIRAGDVPMLRGLLRFETWYRMSLAEPPARLLGEDLTGPPTGWSRLFTLRWRIRAGGAPLAAVVDVAGAGDVNQRLFGDLIEAEARLLADDPVAALDRCLRALRDATEAEWGPIDVEIRQTECDLLAILGRWADLERASDALAARAAAMPTPRYQTQARFFAAVGPGKPVDWGALEQLATQAEVAPIAARRAAFLLGGDPALDLVDHKVLGALRELRGLAPATAPPGTAAPRPAAEPGWGLADEGCRVWLPHGATFALAERPLLWGFLVALYQRGGAASKEELVRDVWAERAYHPLHHDNRLHVTVRKLRHLLEDDPARPTRLVTREGGYALGGRVRRARPR